MSQILDDDVRHPLARRVVVLRMLRLSGLITLVAALVLVVVWWNDPLPLGVLLPWGPQWLVISGGLFLFIGIMIAAFTPRGLVPFFGMCAVVLVFLQGFLWWWTFEHSSFNVGALLAQALAMLSVGLMIISHVMLRCLGESIGIASDDPASPARIRSSPRPGETGEAPERSAAAVWIARPAPIGQRAIPLVPAVVFVIATISLHAVAQPHTQTHASTSPVGPSGHPARIGTAVAWQQDLPKLQEVAAGPAGPLILTDAGITALDPRDGTALWSYHRPGFSCATLPNGPFERKDLTGSRLALSPDRNHLACRIPASGKGEHDALTIVLDTRTGQVTGQHVSNSAWTLQLTDSALLDGATAYDLNTGGTRWTLPNPGSLTGGDIKRRDVHSGAAGHSSFVLMSTPSGDDSGLRATTTVVLIPDSEPDATTKVSDIAVDPFTDRPAIVDGWSVQYTGSSGATAQAITLDSLAGREERAAVPLGETSGPNIIASTVSGTITTYPSYSPRTRDEVVASHGPWAEAVFDPGTGNVTPASRCAGVAAATVDFTRIATDDVLGWAFTLRPSDGSTSAIVPLDERATYSSPTVISDKLTGEHPLLPGQPNPANQFGEALTLVRTPGATVVVLNSAYGSSSGPGQRGPEAGRAYRLHGLPEGVS
ncbi:hypothetical protein [[Pseudopropionibacterium] massiliense]|uniref:hypothetical protein n=1 Tax=[Pseudopropionibacterium] massiliense TaxID=2220000 RepID=UPI0010320B90|nr:hypothetical protein [[Pseudopropionibacterium] massiliense]